MENNNTAETIELTEEFWEWLWEKDGKSYALILLGHTELIEGKYEEYQQAKKGKEGEGDNDTIHNP